MALTRPAPTLTSPEPLDGSAPASNRARPWRPFAVAVVGLLLAALLNAEELERTAARQPVGWQRDALAEVASVPAAVADLVRLDAPRRWAEALLGEEPPATVEPPPSPSPSTAPTSVPSAAPGTSAPTTTAPTQRTPTAADPLHLAVLGDSMMQVLGQSIVNGLAGDDRVETVLEYRVSTGLTRPDYFDWPGRIAALLVAGPVDAAVVMFGANDAQGMVLAGGSEAFGTPAWLGEYRRRVAAVMDQLVAAGTSVYWVGQPVMRSDSFSARMAMLDEIYASEAAARSGVTYVDAWALLSVDGEYATHLDGGGSASVRQSDGIHLSRAGGDRLAAAVIDVIEADWRLDP